MMWRNEMVERTMLAAVGRTGGERERGGNPEAEEPARRPYRAPTLTPFGDVRDLTLGPTPGIGESGAPLVFRA